MTIKLIDAAKYYKELPHQLAAWNWLQEQLTKEKLDEFAELYRSAVDPKPVYQNTMVFGKRHQILVPNFLRLLQHNGHLNQDGVSTPQVKTTTLV